MCVPSGISQYIVEIAWPQANAVIYFDTAGVLSMQDGVAKATDGGLLSYPVAPFTFQRLAADDFGFAALSAASLSADNIILKRRL